MLLQVPAKLVADVWPRDVVEVVGAGTDPHGDLPCHVIGDVRVFAELLDRTQAIVADRDVVAVNEARQIGELEARGAFLGRLVPARRGGKEKRRIRLQLPG